MLSLFRSREPRHKGILMRFTRNWLLLGYVAGGVVFAISCTEVVDPTRSLVPHPHFVEGPLPHGITYTVGAPPNNDFPAAGGTPITSIGINLLLGTVARVYGSGNLNLSLNPECYEDPTWAGITSPVPLSGVLNGGGAVLVNAATSLDNQTQWSTAVGGGSVTYIEGFDSTPTPIMAWRNGGLGVYCTTSGPNDPPTPSVFAYFIGGVSNLVIDILGVSMTASSSSVQPGEAVNYSGTPINFTPAAQISWIFDSPDFAQIDVVGCANQTVCSYTPPRTGSMVVCMYDEESYGICGQPRQVTVAAWINGAPPCRAKVVAHYTRISLRYDSTDANHTLPHMGQDYAEPDTAGVPVSSADSGTVLFAGWGKSAGYAVAVRSANPDPRGLMLDSYYYHLKQGSIAVVQGEAVSVGQFLALSDNSGKWPDGKPSSHGGHVHFEQHTRTPGKGAFPNESHNDRATAVVPCTF
jgi:murein DD-endopeptidase MepM/ murein hydrolase activator NlpD